MSWKNIVKEAECRIEVCKASKCKHNKNMKCTLPNVNISDNGSCLMYSENPASPSFSGITPVRSGGHKSFIARANRTNREQIEQNR